MDNSVESKYDRFDLEEHINHCWTIVEQLQLVKEASANNKDQLIDAIMVLYQHKFIKLWDVLVELIDEGKLK